MPDLLSFLGEVALRSSFVLTTAFVLLFAMKRASASERHLVMLLGVVVVAFLPVGLLVSPKISWTISLPRQAETKGTTQKVTAYFLEKPKNPQPSAFLSAVEKKPSMMEVLTISNGLVALILGGMLVQVIILGRAAWSWQKIRRQAAKACLPDDALVQVQAFAGAKNVPPIYTSDQITVPLLAGWLRPAIILPAEAPEWPLERLVMVLCHEIAHFKRGDALLLPLICALRVLYWWHPLVWLALARLRHERETACDDLVLNQNFRATDYADLIVSTARQVRTLRWQNGTLAMASSSNMGERIGAILNPALNRRPASRTTVFTGLILTFALGWFFVAAQVQAEDQPMTANSTDAPKPQIYVEFKLVEIDERAYEQQPAVIDEAVKNGDISFLHNLQGASIVSGPSITTQVGLKAKISLEKELIQGNQTIPVTTLTAQSVVNADGTITQKIISSLTPGPTKILLGVNFEIKPSLSKDGTILLPIRYAIGEVIRYKSSEDFDSRRTTTDKKLSIVDGKASGFLAGYENVSNGNRYAYSLLDILKFPGDQIKTLPRLSPSPNRLALIVTARQVNAKASVSTAATPEPKPSVKFVFNLVEIDETAYEREAQAMDEAVRTGDIPFFYHRKDTWRREGQIWLIVGQSGWYSIGNVQSYVDSVTNSVFQGKVRTTLTAKSVFLGVNGDFKWSKDLMTLDSTWSTSAPVGIDKLTLSPDTSPEPYLPNPYPVPRFNTSTFTDKNWDMAPGKEHGYWIGESHGWMRHVSEVNPPDWYHAVKPKSKSSFDTLVANWNSCIESQPQTRLAVFMRAEPVMK